MERRDTGHRAYRPNSSSRDAFLAADQLQATRYETQRPRTPPTQVSRIEAASRSPGRGATAQRSRPSIHNIFPIATPSQSLDSPERLDPARRSTSHELSFPHNNARESLVNQILMSFGSPSGENDEQDYYTSSERPGSTPQRSRGHTHSSSTSSGLFQYVRDRSRSQSRGRHAKNKSSGSNFQTTLDRINSVRTGSEAKAPSTFDPRPSTRGRAKKHSAASSIDQGIPSYPQNRDIHYIGVQAMSDTMEVEQDRGLSQDNGGAATSSRRRGHVGSVGSISSQALRPAGSSTMGLRKPGTSPQRPSGGSDNQIQTAENTSDGAGILPPTREARGQAPVVSSTIRHKPQQSNSYKATVFSPNATVGREKGGFFKRMFGGSSKESAADIHTQPAHGSGPRSGSRQGIVDDKGAASVQASVQSSQPAQPAKPEPKEPATLNKKSSFFRRRKKSVAAPAPAVPSLPAKTAWREDMPSRDASPASSLRKVMHPYLQSRPGTRAQRSSSRVDASDSSAQNGEVRLFPMQDAGRASTLEPQTHAHPVPGLHTKRSQQSVSQDGPNASSVPQQEFPTEHTDNEPQPSDPDDRPSRRKTITGTTSSSSTPGRSSSRGWRDRPQTRVYPNETSRRSMSTQRRPEISRSETDTSEVSDGDFASAKSEVASPVNEQPSESFRPPMPATTAPGIPSMTISTTDSPALHEERNRAPLTSDTAKVTQTGRFATLDPARTPTYAPQDIRLADVPVAAAVSPEKVPTDEDHLLADQLFRFNADTPFEDKTLPKTKGDVCPWLGESGEARARVRRAYLEMFDWKNTSILTSLRRFCEHVQLKGETQQLDRVLEALAQRWIDCNQSHGFKAVDVVHTICYSLILLNTDLHIADIENRMTRTQFIRNTMLTVTRVVDDAVPDAFKQSTINAAKRASTLPPPRITPLELNKKDALSTSSRGTSSPGLQPPHSPKESGTVKLTIRRNSNEFERSKFRLSARPSENTAIDSLLGETARSRAEGDPVALANEDCGPLVRQPFFGGRAAWEMQIETVLKNFYGDIQKQKLPLQGSDAISGKEAARATSSLGGQASGSNRIGRSASISSRQSGGERGQSRPTTGTTSRWRSKFGQRPRTYAASNFSVDDDMSMSGISPSASSLWSKHSVGRTQTSMSVTSLRSEGPGQEAYQQSIGFANALSQAIIREEHADSADGDEKDGEAIKAASLLDDDSLELYGAPWAKEGIVKHKHHLESVDKKAKERAWTECFAVIQKGWLQLFRFNSSKTASIRARTLRAAVGGVSTSFGSASKNAPGLGGKVIVGGGNWMDNALPLGRFLLRQSIASALPPPGYSKSRPHVWALSLPSGAVHLFQAGTPDIVKEYVTCANYWSARLSKEPLVGGVSNVEFGWSENLLGDAVLATRPGSRTERAPSSMAEVMSRQRSGSSESPAPAPVIPRRSSRGVAAANRPPSAMHSARPSLQNSIRNSFETTASSSVRPRLPGDQARIADWIPPQSSMVASALMEVDQLRVLTDYVASVKGELEKHNELRPAIQATYNPRHPNYAKTMSNFEKKSAYLLREIVKFSTYVETLQNAQAKKEEVLKEREERKKELDAVRAEDEKDKVSTAEELRRELSKSDLRTAAHLADNESDDVPDVPALPSRSLEAYNEVTSK